MALQGLNVVLVSLPDKFLNETTEILKKQFPNQKFLAVPAVFDHKTDYMPAIIKATEDLDIAIVFNNAGYIVTGFFDQTSVDSQLANMVNINTLTFILLLIYLYLIFYIILYLILYNRNVMQLHVLK